MKYSVILLFILFGNIGFSQIVFSNQGAPVDSILNSLIGEGLTISNAVINCPSNAYSTFANGNSTNIGINNGIILSTGNVNTLNGPGSSFWSFNNQTSYYDPQLMSLDTHAHYDCCILEFDIVPTCPSLQIRFVFGSEEYPEFVSSGYNDAFGFFISGPNPSGGMFTNENVALLPDNSTIVSIDNVNASSNASYYINNASGQDVKLDAITTVLTQTLSIVPCQTYHFKLAIADAGDQIYDSGVFVDFLTCNSVMVANASGTPESCAGNDGIASVNVSGGVPPYTITWNTPTQQSGSTLAGLAPGNYQVTVSDISTCNPPIVQNVTIGTSSNPPVLTINNPVICVGGTATITASAGGAIGTYEWSTGETTATIIVTPSENTTYFCTFSNVNCSATGLSTVTITEPFVPFFNAIPNVCQYAEMPVLPSLSADATPIAGTWSPSFIDSSIIGVQTFYFTPNLGECGFPTSITITVDSLVTPTFNSFPDFCQGDNQALPLTSTNIPSIAGSWNPPNINTTTVGLGTYVFTPALSFCATSVNAEINVKPTPTIEIDSAIAICSGESVTLLANVDLSGGTFSWSESNSTAQNISYQPIETHFSFASYTFEGCTVSDSVFIEVYPVIHVYAGEDVSICSGQSILLNATGTPFIEWDNGISNNTIITPSTTTVYSVIGSTEYGCSTTDEITITVNPLPLIEAGPSISICQSTEIILSASGAGNGGAYSWNNGISNGVPFVIEDTTTFTVIGTNVNGCSNQDSVIVTVLLKPNASFQMNQQAGTAPLNVEFTNTSEDATIYFWDFGNGINTTTSSTEVISEVYTTTNAMDTFLVWLTASNGFCQDSTYQLISISHAPEISFPNVFTPNGDSTNEVYFVEHKFLQSLEVVLFNRWGNVIATIDSPSGFWDGKSKNGIDADAGVYFYNYSAVGINGQELQGQGFITLIR